MVISSARLERAVRDLYPDVAESSGGTSAALNEERMLWLELSVCLLSSQVPYELALAAAEAVQASGAMHAPGGQGLEDRLVAVLSNAFVVDGRSRRYRFPNAKGRQLADTTNAVWAFGGLRHLLSTFEDGRAARAWFVRHAPGLGPKQASMFLRNVGFSHDLAILDRHVLNYMIALGLGGIGMRASRLHDYLVLEDVLRRHAATSGSTVGALDRAIWIVMRVARRYDIEGALS